jgi:hypothetical protein
MWVKGCSGFAKMTSIKSGADIAHTPSFYRCLPLALALILDTNRCLIPRTARSAQGTIDGESLKDKPLKGLIMITDKIIPIKSIILQQNIT